MVVLCSLLHRVLCFRPLSHSFFSLHCSLSSLRSLPPPGSVFFCCFYRRLCAGNGWL
ncbi:hypothetical protein NC651_012462 [Populus alba x Populus x berolinensis]|nr:hypothetical protein NC651_012462 [Populus alba x Populus x berolinensis]